MSDLQADFGVLEDAGEVEPIDEDEIIDVDAMDLEDSDRWLCDSNQCSSESRVHDLYAWLKSDPTVEAQEHPNSLKKSIDTRTFTRAKRRSNRLSFDAIMETLSSPIRNSVETLKISRQFRIDEATASRPQEIPSMLRPKISSLSGLMGESQPSSLNRESLEAFLNLSQSKGIDSFINLTEPEFADCIMNESQPSLLYSSIISTADETRKNDTLCDITDAGILSESMMQTSMFQESLNINSFKEICSKDVESLRNDLTHTLDQTKVNGDSPFNQTKIYASPFERTYVNEDHSQENMEMKVKSVTPINYDGIQNSSEVSPILHSNGSCNLSDTLASLPPHDFSHLKFDTSTPEEARVLTSETFESLNTMRINEISMEDALIDADMTFNVKRLSCQGKVSENPPPNSHRSNYSKMTSNINNNNNNKKTNASCLRQELLEEVERTGRKMDSTFSQEKNQQRDLTITYQNSKETFAAPLDYYKTYTREGSKKFTQSQVDKQQDFSSEMGDKRFQTFRKTTRKEERESINSTFLKNEVVGNVNATFSKDEQVENVNATFSKNQKIEKINATFSKEEQENEEENINATFCKPPQQEIVNSTFMKPQPRKLAAPKNLSKLPHFLQKSNPNIPTSNALRTIKAPGSFAYSKGSHPNIPRAMDRIYSLGKYKSDSEQRLVGAIRNSTEQIGNAGGSTESIESTQSAPDLDDRLSICSDNSRSSYTISTTARTIVKQKEVENLRVTHKLMPHDFKPESTPKPNRQILQNTWVQAENDLPSPILKNNIECPKSNNISPHSDLKSSSPFFSPSSSNENIHSLGVVKNNTREFKAPIESEKLIKKVSNVPSNRAKSPVNSRPRLRPPTNYNAARPVNSASGIPRPASRIPAPKFARPLSRIPDQKKG